MFLDLLANEREEKFLLRQELRALRASCKEMMDAADAIAHKNDELVRPFVEQSTMQRA